MSTYGLYSVNNYKEHLKIVSIDGRVPKGDHYKTAKNYFIAIKNIKEELFNKLFLIIRH